MVNFEIKEINDEFSFVIKASNGKIMASSNNYKNKKACLNGLSLVIKNAPMAKIDFQKSTKYPKFEIYPFKEDKYCYRLIGTNKKILINSEAYSSLRTCKNGLKLLRTSLKMR